jgi:hypothetical protein
MLMLVLKLELELERRSTAGLESDKAALVAPALFETTPSLRRGTSVETVDVLVLRAGRDVPWADGGGCPRSHPGMLCGGAAVPAGRRCDGRDSVIR